MTTTAVPTLHDAVAERIDSIALLADDKVYDDGRVPIGAALPYAVLGSWTEPEDSRRYYEQDGAEQVGQITWWGQDREEAMRAFEQGKLLLEGATLTMTGHTTIRCSLGYLRDFPEPSIALNPPHCVVSRLRTMTVET